jgi:hypothetical protein
MSTSVDISTSTPSWLNSPAPFGLEVAGTAIPDKLGTEALVGVKWMPSPFLCYLLTGMLDRLGSVQLHKNRDGVQDRRKARSLRPLPERWWHTRTERVTTYLSPAFGQGPTLSLRKAVWFPVIMTGAISPHRVQLSYWTEEAHRRYG